MSSRKNSKMRGFFTVAAGFFFTCFFTQNLFLLLYLKKKFVSKLSLLIFLNIELVENLTI
jgi:hypothetical protein